MATMVNTKQARTTTRNFRIPLDMDDEILELQKELGHSSMTQTWIHLVKLGIWSKDNLKKLEADPAMLDKMKTEWEQKRKELTDIEGAAPALAKMSDREMEFLKGMYAIEIERRELERDREKERQAKINFEQNQKLKAAGLL
jgi:hypothetical protein